MNGFTDKTRQDNEGLYADDRLKLSISKQFTWNKRESVQRLKAADRIQTTRRERRACNANELL